MVVPAAQPVAGKELNAVDAGRFGPVVEIVTVELTGVLKAASSVAPSATQLRATSKIAFDVPTGAVPTVHFRFEFIACAELKKVGSTSVCCAISGPPLVALNVAIAAPPP